MINKLPHGIQTNVCNCGAIWCCNVGNQDIHSLFFFQTLYVTGHTSHIFTLLKTKQNKNSCMITVITLQIQANK